MQSFLGIAPAVAPHGAPSASDIATSDTRSASGPKDGDAFRTALDAANRRSSDSGNAERSSSRPAADNTSDATEMESDSSTSEDESTPDAAITADAMAMLLNWLVPPTPTSTPTTPLTMGTGDAPTTTAPIGMVAEGALVASFGMLTALPNGSTAVTTAQDTLQAVSVEAAADVASLATAAGQADPTLASTATDGIDLTGMTATPDGQPLTTTAPLTTPAASTAVLDPSLLAAMQATAEARAASAASEGANTAAAATSAQTTGTAAPTGLASLAADFGAQIVATTGQASRTAGSSASATRQSPLLADAQVPTTGSTAQAAGAGATSGIQLPGQAVAAAGAPSQGTAGTLAEALEAGPEAVAAPQASPENRTDFQTALAAASMNGIGQAQDVDTVQVGAATAPPIASQIADGALMAARRVGQSVEMILQPEGLGSVSLRVSVERGGLAVHMAVENPRAREMVQASWPQLQQALEQRGLTVQSLLLDLSNGRGGGEGFQAFQQFSGHQQFNGQQARGGASNGDRRGSLTAAPVDESAPAQADAGPAARVDYRI